MSNLTKLRMNGKRWLQMASLGSVLLIGAAGSVVAQVWVGTGADNNWTTNENWNTGVAPVSATSTTVTLSGSTSLSPNVDTPYTVKGITFTGGPFNLSGQEISVQGTDGTLDIVNNSTNDQVINNSIKLLSNSGISTGWNTSYGSVTVNGNVNGNGKTLTFANSSAKALTVNGIISGANWVSINGGGRTTFTAANTYTGGMAVYGKFQVNGSLASGGTVVVTGGGQLEGNGTINKAVNIQTGSSLSAGDTDASGVSQAALLTLGGNLVLDSGSALKFDLGTLSDRISVAGNLTLDGTLNVLAGTGFTAGTYTLFTYSGALTNNTLDVGSMPGGYTYTIDTGTAGIVSLNVVPEPQSWILMGVAFSILLVFRRKSVWTI